MTQDRPTVVLETARRRVADRYPGCTKGIIAGGWDTGKLVQDEVARLRALGS